MILKRLVFLSSLMSVVNLSADVAWSTNGKKLYDSDGATFLAGSSVGASGCFIQLIDLGTSADANTKVTASNYSDSILATSFVGSGAFLDYSGQFYAPDYVSSALADGTDFAIRIFNSVSPNYAMGIAPTTGLYTYQLFLNPGKDVDGDFDLVINNNLSTTQAIPEPVTMAILLPGAGMLGLWRRRRRNTVASAVIAQEVVADVVKAEREEVRDVNRFRDWAMKRRFSN